MFDKKVSYKLDSALINQPFLKYHFSQRVRNYPEYFRDFSETTSGIGIPVLFNSGSRDHTIGPDHPKYMNFPGMQLKTVPGGHALYLENNAELYKAVKRFLKRFS